MKIGLHSVIFRHQDHVSAQVNDELVVLSIEQGKYFGFDDIAQAIWDRLEVAISVEELCLDLAKSYNAPLPTIQTDVLKLLNTLSDEGIILQKQ